MRLNLPIILTFSRIFLIPFFIFVAEDYPVLAVLIFSIAAITDFLDGYLARRSGQITNFGIILDPIADKFLIISALIFLVGINKLNILVAVIIIVREFLVTALRVVALSRNIIIPAEMGGKLKTTAQIAGIICLILPGDFLGINFWGMDLNDIGADVIAVSLVLAVISGIQYTVLFWKRL